MKVSTQRPIAGRSGRAILGAIPLVALLTLATPVWAAPYTGGFSPTIIGQKADLNGDSVVTGRDDANAFYGDTHIIDGQLDCNDWGTTANAGAAGDNEITATDDCTLIGVDGTSDGVTIQVENGLFQVGDGPLPFVFNASDPDNPDISDSDFAWSAINGRVDSSGNETIDANDCHLGLIGETVDAGLGDPRDGADILGNDAGNTNPCGFAVPPADADDGLVDLNSDGVITAAGDSCTNGCFFGHDVDTGVVQAIPGAVPPAGPTKCMGQTPTHLGTNAGETIGGTSGNDVIQARGGNDTIRASGGRDLICAGSGNDFAAGQGARDTIKGGSGRDRIKGGASRDNLRGQGGRDKLSGQGGNDRLNGGPSRDRCNGGPGIDVARACEVERRIP